jgi:hypothetical protein
VSPALSHILSTTVATASYGPEKLDDASPAPSPHTPFASAAKEFRDDPHIAGQRSNYIRNQRVTPTGRPAALFTEKARGYNGYYLWFSTIRVQAADPYSDVVPNAWKAPFSLYFEARAAGRKKFELLFPRGRWLKALIGDLVAGTLSDGPTDHWTAKGYVVAPRHRVRHRVAALGDRWFGFEINFGWGAALPRRCPWPASAGSPTGSDRRPCLLRRNRLTPSRGSRRELSHPIRAGLPATAPAGAPVPSKNEMGLIQPSGHLLILNSIGACQVSEKLIRFAQWMQARRPTPPIADGDYLNSSCESWSIWHRNRMHSLLVLTAKRNPARPGACFIPVSG